MKVQLLLATLAVWVDGAAAADELAYEGYSTCDRALFERTLLRSYDGTRDCPEVNGVRTIAEIIAGHRAQGKHDPDRWWLAFAEDQPVGVLLVAQVPEWHACITLPVVSPKLSS